MPWHARVDEPLPAQLNLLRSTLLDFDHILIKQEGISNHSCAVANVWSTLYGFMQEHEDGEPEEVFVAEDVMVGEEISDLAMQCLDAAGRPVPEGTPGKVRATWIQGTKKMKYAADGIFGLLNIKVLAAALLSCPCCLGVHHILLS